MSLTRSELIAKIKEQRRVDKSDDKRGLSKMKKTELLELVDEYERPDNVNVEAKVEVKVEDKIERLKKDEIVDESESDTEEEKKDLGIEEDLFSIREAKIKISAIADEFKNLVKSYITEAKYDDANIDELVEEHNYEKDVSKYEIEDILDFTDGEMPERFMAKIDNIFISSTEKFSAVI